VDAVRHIVDVIASAESPEIDWLSVHDAGCTSDDTTLPHHVSDWTEV